MTCPYCKNDVSPVDERTASGIPYVRCPKCGEFWRWSAGESTKNVREARLEA